MSCTASSGTKNDLRSTEHRGPNRATNVALLPKPQTEHISDKGAKVANSLLDSEWEEF